MFASDELKDDLEVVYGAVIRNEETIEYASQRIQSLVGRNEYVAEAIGKALEKQRFAEGLASRYPEKKSDSNPDDGKL